MTGRVAIRLPVVVWSPVLVCQPFHGVRLRLLVLVLRQELDRLGPQSRNRLRAIVKVNREAVGLVVIAHVAEDIVIHIAEEVHVGLNTPVVLHVEQRRVLVEQAAVPATHLVVALQARVLYVLLFQ